MDNGTLLFCGKPLPAKISSFSQICIKVECAPAAYACFVFVFPLDVTINDKKLTTIFGELIWEELSQCIIHECLLYSIPTNSSQLEKYNIVRHVTLIFFISDSASNLSCDLYLFVTGYHGDGRV